MNRVIFFLFIPLIFADCLGIPENITPVKSFQLNNYLGKWYEIARLDHSFEHGLEQVTAEYSLRDDDGVKVINKGFNSATQKWKEAEGKAFFVEDKNTGYLKVSFFGPFYGSYVIFELDKDYRYAFITSSDKSYLWFLSRTATISDELKNHFLETAGKLGFNTKELIFVKQK